MLVAMTTSVSDADAASLKEASADGRGFPIAAGGHSSSQAKFELDSSSSSHETNVLLLSENPTTDSTTKVFACEGKQRFQSHVIVNKVLKRMAKSRGTALTAYKCKHCGFIHIGNRTKRVR